LAVLASSADGLVALDGFAASDDSTLMDDVVSVKPCLRLLFSLSIGFFMVDCLDFENRRGMRFVARD
jgi:hypothetical protein